jgi:hypothetical protein
MPATRMQVTFRCRTPCTTDTIQLEGMSSYDAATHCASLMAAQRLAASSLNGGSSSFLGSLGPISAPGGQQAHGSAREPAQQSQGLGQGLLMPMMGGAFTRSGSPILRGFNGSPLVALASAPSLSAATGSAAILHAPRLSAEQALLAPASCPSRALYPAAASPFSRFALPAGSPPPVVSMHHALGQVPAAGALPVLHLASAAAMQQLSMPGSAQQQQQPFAH